MTVQANTTDQIRFDDGAAYQRYMGVWSQLVGAAFLDWLAPPRGLRWLDVGCGNGAFTELIAGRCATAAIEGIDPSEEQLAYARSGPAARLARFQVGDAMAVPFAEATFDVAVMPLVIFFVPEPAKGVAEMARVVRPGGIVTAYGWDMRGGGFPYHALQAELRAMGVPVPAPPHPEAADLAELRALWAGAGLQDVETHEITVRRTFASADDYWQAARGGPSIGRQLRELPAERLTALQETMRAHLATDASGDVVCTAKANAVRGRVRAPWPPPPSR